MSLPPDTSPGIANASGYLQHHLQELTKQQNVSEHAINTTLAGLMAQLQQLTQLMTSSAPALTIALPPVPIPSPPVSSPSPVPDTLSKQRARPKLPSSPDFSGERSSGQAFFNSCTLYLHLALCNDRPQCLQVFYTWTASLFHITLYI